MLLQQQARTLGIGLLPNKPVNQGAGLEVEEGTRGVECPMNGSLVDVSVALGQIVKAGESLMVISAMKMETAVSAPCSGEISALADLEAGRGVVAGEVHADTYFRRGHHAN